MIDIRPHLRSTMPIAGAASGVYADVKDGKVVGLIMTDDAFKRNTWLMNEARPGFSVSWVHEVGGPVYMQTTVPPAAVDYDEACEGLAAFRNLVTRIDGDGGQKQEGESVAETLARADAVVVDMQVRLGTCDEVCDCRVCVSFR